MSRVAAVPQPARTILPNGARPTSLPRGGAAGAAPVPRSAVDPVEAMRSRLGPISSALAGLRVPGVTLLLVSSALAVRAFGLDAAFSLDRERLLAEPWRLLTGQIAHWTGSQLLWDAATLAILGAVCELRFPARTRAALLATALAVPAAVVLLEPEISAWRGLSAFATALFVLLVVRAGAEAAARRDALRIAVLGTLAVLFATKLVVEARLGASLFAGGLGAGVRSDPLAHLVGATAGLLAAVTPSRRILRHAGMAGVFGTLLLAGGCATIKVNDRVQESLNVSSALPEDGRLAADFIDRIEVDGATYWRYTTESPFDRGERLEILLSTSPDRIDAVVRPAGSGTRSASRATILTRTYRDRSDRDAGVCEAPGDWRPARIWWEGNPGLSTNCDLWFSWYTSELADLSVARVDATAFTTCPRPAWKAAHWFPLYVLSFPFDVATSPLWIPAWLKYERDKCPFSILLNGRSF